MKFNQSNPTPTLPLSGEGVSTHLVSNNQEKPASARSAPPSDKGEAGRELLTEDELRQEFERERAVVQLQIKEAGARYDS